MLLSFLPFLAKHLFGTKVLVYGILSCPLCPIPRLNFLSSIPDSLGQGFCSVFHSWPYIPMPMAGFLLHAVKPWHNVFKLLSNFSGITSFGEHAMLCSSTVTFFCDLQSTMYFHSCLLLPHPFAQLTACLFSTYECVRPRVLVNIFLQVFLLNECFIWHVARGTGLSCRIWCRQVK